MKSKLVKSQTKTIDKQVNSDGVKRIIVNIRYDDQCGNGYNSFSITGTTYSSKTSTSDRCTESSGCIHDDIIKYCPELEPLIKWHLTSSNEPMYYLANTLYHAGDKDSNNLKKGEFRSFVYKVMVSDECLYTSRVFYSFRDWLHRDEAKQQAEDFLSAIKPDLNPAIVQIGHGQPSEGKEPELEYARSSAVWPEATLEQLQDKNQLQARLPALMTDFKVMVESLGFIY
jgi:hypothetical protein